MSCRGWASRASGPAGPVARSYGWARRRGSRVTRLAGGGLAIAALSAWAAGAGKVGTFVRGFPSPGDYPEGLAYDGHYLWSNNYDNGHLYKVDPSTGATVGDYLVDRLPVRPEGLAWDGTYLWTIDDGSDLITKVLPTANSVQVVESFPKPDGSGPARGIEWDGHHLWLACWSADVGGTAQLYEIDATTHAAIRSVPLPIYWVEDLAWDGRYLWSSDWLFDIGFAIDPTTGDTLHTYRPPGPHPVGQAWDGTHLWTSDTVHDSLYALDISEARTGVRAVSWSEVKRTYGR